MNPSVVQRVKLKKDEVRNVSKILVVGAIAGLAILWHKTTFGRYPWESARMPTPIRVAPRPTTTRLPEDHGRGEEIQAQWRMFHGYHGSIMAYETTGTFG